MGVILNFDSAGITPSAGLPPVIPLAEYNVMMTDSGKSATSAGDGEYMFVDLKIIDGPLAGRVQTDRMNLWNKSEKTVEIAKERLSAYCHLTKKYKWANSEEMHGIPFKAIIGPQVDSKGEQSTKYSEVKELKNMDGTKPGLTSGTPVATSSNPFASPVATGAPVPAAAPTFGPPVAVATAPPAPVAVSAPPPAPIAFPPADWTPHPDAPGYFYKGQEVLSEADLRKKLVPVPAATSAPPAPGAPVAFGAPAAAAPVGGTPPWAVAQS